MADLDQGSAELGVPSPIVAVARHEHEAVQSTNDDATLAKWCGEPHGAADVQKTPTTCGSHPAVLSCAVRRGYWADPYVSLFAAGMKTHPCSPLIHRGYFVRVQAVERTVRSFIAQHGAQAQILSLGAGFDTLFFRLMNDNVTLRRYVEVDFPAVVEKKRQICSSKAPLRSVLSDLASPSEVASLLDRGRLDPGLPLLVISECVLVYMAPEAVANLIQWTSSTFDLAYWLDYEPVCGVNQPAWADFLFYLMNRDMDGSSVSNR
ncbi:uncharacterized protein MONBRDRAFT_22106 [Monosiga brevicollis MX1]|uniref:Leucine carboxyl methyltransferase 1 n=1 Tax=Monosiga brevicollis TaxID=81824 RepID=A9UPK8_MONBE|nr:uncharacterized protein MONBRDRAFT_22106 [Monosiga brevicollis MX1]EDQ92887.1 predicted protein [Monosiga brevicollis MX1]|eukprot:XP_001742649.1 hypothetical protein [Monosiga brevicollis MX1]